MQHTKFCTKLQRQSSETNIQSAMHCVALIEKGCALKDGNFSNQSN